MGEALYDQIGVGYARHRRPDPRIAAYVVQALGSCASALNVGAGAGSYEPEDRPVFAVEPATAMIGQRRPGAAAAVAAAAEHLPVRDRAVAAALAVLTIHHWPDWRRGLRELRRVSRERVVLLTWDPGHDVFLGAYGRRPAIYLDAGARGAISTFAKLPGMEPGLGRLESDLRDGSWQARFGGLLDRSELDVGYRLVIGRG